VVDEEGTRRPDPMY